MEGELKRRALMESPKVSVAVRDYASHTILVSGLVKDSGTKILRREAIPLYVVVADAQPLPEAAKVTVVRTEANEAYDIDLNQPAEMNLLVRPGDVITLHANVTQFVYIGGEVKSPGEKTFRRGLTLTQALISAGGVTEKAKEVRLGRDDGNGFLSVTRIKLKDIESGKVPDPQVRPGDRITIVK
jgi:protein involved in polysaccharide export with SLBB domain